MAAARSMGFFDPAAVERLTVEVTKSFISGLQAIAAAAAQEVELQRQEIATQAKALARERGELEEAWSHLYAERRRNEASSASFSPRKAWARPAGGHASAEEGGSEVVPKRVIAYETDQNRYDPTPKVPYIGREASQRGPAQRSPPEPAGAKAPAAALALSTRAAPSPRKSLLPPPAPRPVKGADAEAVPFQCTLRDGFYRYAVLPVQGPDAPNLGHDLWNQAVELPSGWEVFSTEDDGFATTITRLSKKRWGAMVLGVQNGNKGFDAYWTPLFGDGGHAGQRCQADVDWIEPADDEAPPRRFRMTYTGLRLVIRSKVAAELQAPAPGAPAVGYGPTLLARVHR